MGPEGSLPCSQKHATVICSEPVESSPHPVYLGEIGLFLPGVATEILYVFLISPIRAICITHLISLDLIALIKFG
jgi:hypothetical protein